MTDEKLQLIHFCFSLDPSYGGVSNGVVSTAKELTKFGISNQIVSTGNTVSQIKRNYILKSDLKALGIECIETVARFENEYGFGSLRGLRRELDHLIKPDLVVLHQIYTFSTFLGYIYAKKYRIPFVIQPHGSLTKYHEAESKIKKAMAKWLVISKILNEAERIIVTCESERDDLKPLLKAKSYLVGYGVNSNKNLNQSEKVSPRNNPVNHIVFCGRFDKKKNLRLVIRAMPQILESYPELILNIAGTGTKSEIKAINNLVSDLDLTRNVRFFGWIDSSKMQEIFVYSRLLVLPSENENFAIVVAEALSAGVPCVVSKFVGTADIIAKHHAGEVIEELTPSSVAQGIVKVLQGDWKKYSDAAYEAVELSLNWTSIAHKWKDLIKALV